MYSVEGSNCHLQQIHVTLCTLVALQIYYIGKIELHVLHDTLLEVRPVEANQQLLK